MTFTELRRKHPRFIYESFEVKEEGGKLSIQFSLTLEPDIIFHPTLTIPIETKIDKSIIDLFAFHLGMVECISYWKAACPVELVVRAGSLNQEQITFWHDLFLNGLGEFFYKNNIDFTQKDFLRISSSLNPNTKYVIPAPLSRDLVLVGGGKDSALTLELLKKSGHPTRPLVLNPTRAALDAIKIAGLTNPIIVKRTIDPKLLELNNMGYLNGHTPFSAYLAFLGLFVAVLHGYENVIVSNEASASEGNVMFHGVEVNHQYSKSYRFEKMFREYAQKYLTDKYQYFSLLRPLNELQISKMFSEFPQYFSSFRSCNVGSKTDSWCGKCAKCASTFLMLFPFVAYEQVISIFGGDLFTKPEIIGFVRELVGLGSHKPFECVVTTDEAKLAVTLSIKRYQSLGKEPPRDLLNIEKEIGVVDERVLSARNNNHFVPEAYLKIL